MLKVFYLFLFLPIVYLITNFAIRIPILAQNILPYTLIYVGCLGAIALVMVYLSIRYRLFLGGKSAKEKISKFIEVVNDTFRSNLAVDKILEYELAVCGDYAKLTASLFFHIFPDSELYFITIPSHVAVGIKITNECYVFDKRLPILSLDKWLIKWNKKADIYISRLLRDPEGMPKVTFDFIKQVKKPKKSKADLPKINTEKLTEEIAKILGIKQSSHNDKPDLRIPLSNYAIYYDNDEITKYSLIRAIKNRLESEFCGNMDKISKVAITQNEKDLTVAVSI
jgi:predicted transglutaminase-like protease